MGETHGRREGETKCAKIDIDVAGVIREVACRNEGDSVRADLDGRDRREINVERVDANIRAGTVVGDVICVADGDRATAVFGADLDDGAIGVTEDICERAVDFAGVAHAVAVFVARRLSVGEGEGETNNQGQHDSGCFQADAETETGNGRSVASGPAIHS